MALQLAERGFLAKEMTADWKGGRTIAIRRTKELSVRITFAAHAADDPNQLQLNGR